MTTIKQFIKEINLTHWKELQETLERELKGSRFIYRGQESSDWKLTSKLDRLLQRLPPDDHESISVMHLRNFQLSTRGRRGPASLKLENDDEWWSLGQHYGLATPLLDWTESPFVALFFGFEKESITKNVNRAVYALDPDVLLMKSGYDKFLMSFDKYSGAVVGKSNDGQLNGIGEIVGSTSDENMRLVNQRSVFVRLKKGTSLEDLINSFASMEIFEKYNSPVLYKFIIPDIDREKCLLFLNKMNINHLTLYPDLIGSTTYCNNLLELYDIT